MNRRRVRFGRASVPRARAAFVPSPSLMAAPIYSLPGGTVRSLAGKPDL